MPILSFIGHTLTEFFGKKLTMDDKYINKRVWVLIHQTMSLSGVEKKITFKKCVHETVKN